MFSELHLVLYRLSLWYVLATEDDKDKSLLPIDNYSIHRRYEITLAHWERLGKRWHGHVDTHTEFLRNAELRDRGISVENISTGRPVRQTSAFHDDYVNIDGFLEEESDDEFWRRRKKAEKARKSRSSTSPTRKPGGTNFLGFWCIP